MKIKIANKEIRQSLNIETPDFPKYVTQLLNLANQNTQGTRPKTVGQMSELIQLFPGKTIAEWQKWYIEKHPEAIKNATFRLATIQEEAKDIDGYINDAAVSIKPDSYKTKMALSEKIDTEVIFYTKAKNGIELEFD
ncbi:MAG: hypothetical protein CO102_02845 [Candidatus Brennerbacteria bacterium CG_4_9_14_3_um_filter_43_9]|uniref:MjaI family restriction endonuclease n=1 Tax=Candidatus Brennerbacteria bacterium CG_4_9_14_3_um_filter_43_9 TaxID=1974522 RepID=A0A2M8C128_9BACT|nr:MAG: hypothetical protein CO102_02845 [Candidatus Brennerbacteria bacterium CG_4_9_14_3_um_filter_43_9]